jgi:hypothetical protein
LSLAAADGAEGKAASKATPIKSTKARMAPSLRRRKETPMLEHDPEKWKPVFRKDHAPTTS